jgi:hypothetical protein
LVAIAGWTTAIVALVSGGDASAPSESGRPVAEAPAGPSPTTPAAPTLAEEPCGVAAATAEAQALTNIRSVPSATTDGTGSVRRLKLRCELSADELSLTVNLLRSTDAAAVKASFDFNRVASLNQDEGLVAPLPEVGKQAFTTTGRPSPSGRVVVAVDVLGTDRAISISATTSADYPAAKARDVLVALAKAHVTAP